MKRKVPLLMAALMMGAACGSDDDGTSATSTSATGTSATGTSATGASATPTTTGAASTVDTASSTAATAGSSEPETTGGTDMTPPTGEPIVLAMISLESGPGALPDPRQAAEAAVAYVNSELGGAAGRPLNLETCITDGSPEQSSSCANQLLEKNPVAFVGELDIGTSGSMPIIENSGVPRIGAAAVTPELLFSPASFAFGLTHRPTVTNGDGRGLITSTSPALRRVTSRSAKGHTHAPAWVWPGWRPRPSSPRSSIRCNHSGSAPLSERSTT